MRARPVVSLWPFSLARRLYGALAQFAVAALDRGAPLPMARYVTTRDLSLAAFLMMNGAHLQGWDRGADRLFSFTLTGRRIDRLVHAWYSNEMIFFSPRVFMKHRAFLKMVDAKRRPRDWVGAGLKSDEEQIEHVVTSASTDMWKHDKYKTVPSFPIAGKAQKRIDIDTGASKNWSPSDIFR